MLKTWGRRSSFNVQKVMWLVGELGLAHEHIDAGGSFGGLDTPEFLAMNPHGRVPVIADGDLVLAESGAVVDYIIAKYGNGRLKLAPDHPGFAQFLFWFHFSNGTLQAQMGRKMILNRLKLPEDNPIPQATRGRLDRSFDLVNARLGEAEYLAGEFSAADIMIGFSLTTMRYFMPYDIGRCPNILRYLTRIGARPAYRRAMDKGDPGMKLLLS